jgi:hypothetical protein
MRILAVFLLIIAVNLVPNGPAFGKPNCPNFQGSFLSPSRIYNQDVSQVEVYQTACEKLTLQHYQYKDGVYLTDPVVHATDGVWKTTAYQKTLSVLLADRFVTISNYGPETICTRTTWFLLEGHIRVVRELVHGEVNDPIEILPSNRVLSTETTLYGRIRRN